MRWWSVLILSFYVAVYYCTILNTKQKEESWNVVQTELRKATPYLAVMDELWAIFYDSFIDKIYHEVSRVYCIK